MFKVYLRTMLLLCAQQESLGLPLLELVSHHVGGLSGVVLDHPVRPSLHQDLYEPLAAVLGCVVQGRVASIVLGVHGIRVLVST